MSGNPYKITWDLFILALLLFVCIVVPYRLAFFPDEQKGPWFVIYSTMDFCFLIDIVVTFFTSVNDEATCTEITDRKKIASLYLKGWFWIDTLSIFPFDLIASAYQ